MRCALLIAAAFLVPPVSALAQGTAVFTQAGPAGDVAIELARQTGASIVVADPQVARRMVRPLRGRMQTSEAVRRLARAAGGRAVQVSPTAWRIESTIHPAPTAPALPSQARRAVPTDPAAGQPIVVIASKRDLTFGQVPGQVSIIDGSSLEVGGVGGTEKITQRLATVTSTHLGSGRNKLFIRGIADSSFTGPTQATVGQYLGDLRLTYNAPDPDLRLSDMARVEVLEGPQGTLYGAGSLGGIIRLVPNAPVLGSTGGSVALGGSLTQRGSAGGDAAAMINLPLGDALAFRANIDAASLGGYIDKPNLVDRRPRNDVNRTRIFGGRAGVRAEITPQWTVDVLGLGQSTHARDSQYATRGAEPPLSSDAPVREGSEADYAMAQLVVTGRIGDVKVRSTTGAVRQDLEERYDASTSSGPPRLFYQTNRTRMIAHETRVWQPERHGFSWLVGASFTHNRTVLTRGFETETASEAATGVRNTINEATLFAEGSVRLRPGLTATAGGRLTHSRLGGAGEDLAPGLAQARAEVTADRSSTSLLPSLALNAELLAQTSLYMRYQEGFRPGGFAIESEFVRRFKGDRTRTWEFGVRHGRPGIGTFDVAASASYTRWHDIQADFIDNVGLPSTANIGDGRVWSASLTAGLQPVAGLRVEAGTTWNQSKVGTPTTALLALVARVPQGSIATASLLDATLARSRQVPNIAQLSGRIAVTWNRELAHDLRLNANGWASYVGKSRLGIGPELGRPQGDYLDSGVDLRIGSEHRGVTLAISNLTNSRGNRFSLGTPFGTARDQVTPLRPRTVRLGLDARF